MQYKHAVHVEYGNKKDSMVDKTQAMFKWTEKATHAMEKNADCNLNLTAGPFESVLEVAVDTCVMLCRNISTSSGLVNGAVGAVIKN